MSGLRQRIVGSQGDQAAVRGIYGPALSVNERLARASSETTGPAARKTRTLVDRDSAFYYVTSAFGGRPRLFVADRQSGGPDTPFSVTALQPFKFLIASSICVY